MPYRSFILLIGLLLPLSNLLHAQSSLALSSASVPPGGATALNLSLSSDPSNQPAALEWTFSYPTASVATLSVDAGPALSAAGKSVSCAAGANSYTCVAWGLNSNPISDGVVATLSLTLSGSNSLPVAIGNGLGASLTGDEIGVTGTGGVVSVTAVTGITSLTCTPGSLAPSASSTCTVILDGPGGGTIGLSSSTNNLAVPASVTIPSGLLSGTFSATAAAFTADQNATVTGTLNGSSKSATLSLTTLPTVSSLQCNSANLASNASTTCTVTLSKSVAASTAVALSNSLPSVLTVATSVSVAANATSATFTASTGALVADQSATITASLNGSSKPVTLSLTAPLTVSALQCNAGSLGAQASTTCTVTLSKSVAGSTVVALTNSAPSVLTVSPSVTVAANAASATFTASTGALPADQSATITATVNGSSQSVTLSLTTLPAVSTLQCAATTLASNASTTCTVTLTKSVTSSTVVALTNSASSVLTVPPSVTVAASAASATFTASTGAVVSDQSATVTAALNGSSQPVTLSLTAPMTVSSLQCTAASLPSNASTSCTVKLSKSAARDTMVTISDNAPALNVPSTAHVAPTSNSSTFTISTGALVADQSATVTATFNGTSAAATISLVGPATLSSFQCAASSLASNASTTCTVTLSKIDPAPVTVSLTSSLPSLLTVPGTLTVPANSAFASFTVSAATITTAQGAIVGASLGATNLTAGISLVVAPVNKPLSLSCTPVTLTPGTSGNCAITLGVPATSPTLVTLLATNSAFLVPASLTIPTGATSGNVQFVTTNTLSGWVILLATSGSLKQTFTFSVPPKSMTSTTNLVSLACSKRIASGLTGVCDLSLSPSTTSQTAISLTSSSSRLRVPENLQAEAGQTAIRFEVNADDVATEENAILEARVGDSAVRESLDVVSAGPHLLAPRRVAGTPSTPVRFQVSTTGSATIKAAGLPQGSLFDTNTGDFEWNPLAADQGEHEISFIATDALGARAVRTVVVYVGTGAPVASQLRNMAGSTSCSPGAISSVSGWFLSASETPLADRSGRSGSLDDTRVLVNGAYTPILSASPGQVEFLCPSLPAGTPLDIAVETRAGQSGALRTMMGETAPAILTVDGSLEGQALAIHPNSAELAALPSFRYRARPALSGQSISVWVTGVECSPSQSLRLNLGGQSVAAESMQSLPQMAGACQVAFRVPSGVIGDSVSLSLEVTRSDATLAVSNRTSVTVQPLPIDAYTNLNLEEKQ